jgi:peroxiredoxin
MSKSLFPLILIILLFSCARNPDQFFITGNNANAGGQYVYIYEMSTRDFIPVDSAQITDDGLFQLTGTTDMVRFYALEFKSGTSIILLVHPGDHIEVNGNAMDMKDYTIKGSSDSEKIRELSSHLNNALEQIYQLSITFNDSSKSPNFMSIKQELDKRYEEIIAAQRDYTFQFIRMNISSLASLMALYQQVSPRRFLLDPVEDISYFYMVDSALQLIYPKSEAVIELHRQVTEIQTQQNYLLQSEKHLAVGALAPDIALPGPDGDTIMLSSLKGRIVLLDFWATWCLPCREENPNLVNLHDRFSSKGFEIYQVSLDKSRASWLRGIEEDHLDWVHVSDLKMWESVVVSIYGLQGIPMNFLLDRDGRIIDKNLRGQMLEDKLTEIFRDK